MLDRDLAELYQVETRTLKQAVRRNIERFPEDFMMRLSAVEANKLIDIGRSQNVIPQDYNISSSEMFAFTEEGVAMLSGVLRSKAAGQVNIAIMRAFVAMRNYITTATTVTAELAEIRAKLALLERADAENAEAVSDLSEDMRKELDNIYQAIAALSIKIPQARRPANPIVRKRKNNASFHSIGEIGFFLMFRKFRIFNGLGKLRNSGFTRRYSPAAPALVLVTTSTKPLCNTGKTCPMCIGHNGSGIDRIVCHIPLHRISQTETKPCEKMPARALSTPRPTSSR